MATTTTSATPPTFTISALAREFDITPRAIRFYEDQGILSPSRAGRNRVYAARDRARLKLLLRGKRLGLSLSEVRALIDMYDSPRDTEAQLREFLAVLARHRATLERQREDIGTTLAEIAAHEAQCNALLAAQACVPAVAPKRTRSRTAVPQE
jgi:DNA-binding transcriptional MerR regulator